MGDENFFNFHIKILMFELIGIKNDIKLFEH